jgi:hypothetical protein
MSDHLPAAEDQNRNLMYEFRIRGHLGARILGAFDGLQAETNGQDTLLRGAVQDQAALHGVLAQIEALGLELVEVRRLPRGARE